MQSKARLRFHNRLAHYDADIELADILKKAVAAGALRSPTKLFPHVSAAEHPRIAARVVTEHNRKLAIGHLNNTVRASFLKDIYEDFTAYLQDLLVCCAKKTLDPNRLIGEHKFSINANDLLALGSWPSVVQYVSATLFRKIENEQSTKKLLLAFEAKLALTLTPSVRDAALPYFDMRHILVHRDGVVDEEFCAAHPHLRYVQGNKLQLSLNLINSARNAISDLLDHIDNEVIRLNLLNVSDTTQ